MQRVEKVIIFTKELFEMFEGMFRYSLTKENLFLF